MKKKIAFLFPGQGAQYPGMGKDFANTYSEARYVFEEANEILQRNLSKIIWEGSEAALTETKNSQVAIYVTSMAILKVIYSLFPNLLPYVTSGLSLGEYSALTAAKKLPFGDCLSLVERRGIYMNEACEKTRGGMAVVMGLSGEAVESFIEELNLPKDLWAANFNCPGQVVISGTQKGLEIGTLKAKELGAKRTLPLQVHGAFHSGLMESAEEKLKEEILKIPFQESDIAVVMNFSGDFAKSEIELKRQLIKQVTSPVRWEQGIRKMCSEGVDFFLEVGCGKTLSGMNKRIGVTAPTLSIEKIDELEALAEELSR